MDRTDEPVTYLVRNDKNAIIPFDHWKSVTTATSNQIDEWIRQGFDDIVVLCRACYIFNVCHVIGVIFQLNSQGTESIHQTESVDTIKVDQTIETVKVLSRPPKLRRLLPNMFVNIAEDPS